VQNSITLSMELLQVIFCTKNGIVVLAKPPALLGYELGSCRESYCNFDCTSELINESMTTKAKIMKVMVTHNLHHLLAFAPSMGWI